MGINTSIAKLLVRARLHGVSFARTGTIGRQSLAIPKKDVKAIARKLGVRGLDWSRFAANGFAATVEPFRYLSALEEFKGRLRQARENSLSNDRFFEPLERVI
jgi:hypothetical protein